MPDEEQPTVTCRECGETLTATPDRQDQGEPFRLPLHSSNDGRGYCVGSLDKITRHATEGSA